MRFPLFAVVLFFIFALLLNCEETRAEITVSEAVSDSSDSTRLLIPLPFFSKMGFQSGFVNTKQMDTGVDFGALLSKDFYNDFLEITSTFHLWGATNDTLDVATAGIDGNFTYKVPIRKGLYGYAGFILSGCYFHSEKKVTNNGSTTVTTNAEYQFQKFITAGMEFDLHENRTFFVQIKYGKTQLSKEVHIIGGINFYTKYKKFIPWLAPPLMRD